MIRGLFILLVFQCLGELIKTATGTVLPGPVIGLLLLLIALMVRGEVSESVGTASTALISQLALLLLPPSVGLFFLGAQLQGQWAAIAGAIVGGTVLTLLFCTALMRLLVKITGKDQAP